MHSENLLDALRGLIRAEIAAELDRQSAGDENRPQQAENPAKTTEKPDERQAVEAERGAEQDVGQAERGAADEIGQAERARDPIVPLEGRGPEPTDKDRAALTAALKALISEQNDAAQEFRHLVREGKQCACSACRDWSDFECVVDFINYRRELKNGRA